MAKHGLKLPRRQTSGLYAGTVLWKEPNSPALLSLLKNPAYAGAFAYGRRIADPARQVPGRPATGKVRQPRDRWLALVKDVYPAYITWEEHERVLATIEENRQKMAERLTRKQAIRRGAALLTGLVRCGRCGHAMQVTYKDNRFQYVCHVRESHHARPNCQYLTAASRSTRPWCRSSSACSGRPRSTPWSASNARQAEHQQELERHLEQEVRRLEYAASRAERQYDSVDPENRLIASTLEKRWEDALVELEQAKARLAELKARGPQPVAIPEELRAAFADVGRRLPEMWERLPVEARKTMLRTLGDGRQPRSRRERHRAGSGSCGAAAWSARRSFARADVVTIRDHGAGERGSSTRIRRAVEEGRDDAAIAEVAQRAKASGRAAARPSPPRSSGSSAAAIAS